MESNDGEGSDLWARAEYHGFEGGLNMARSNRLHLSVEEKKTEKKLPKRKKNPAGAKTNAARGQTNKRKPRREITPEGG